MPRRIPSDQFTEIGVPSAGMDTDTVPRLLPPTKAPLIKNFLMDRPGVLPMRGPICEGVTWNPGSSIGLMGIWSYDDKVLIGRCAASATATRDHWVSPYRYDTDPGGANLRQGNLTLKHINLATGTVTDVAAASRARIPGPKFLRIGDIVYGLSGDGTTTSAIRGVGPNVQRYVKLLTWSGGTVTPASYTNCPLGAEDLAYHYNRLFLLGGTQPDAIGGTQPNTLWWTDQLPTDGTALTDALASWQDDVSGLYNRIVIGGDDARDFGAALAHVGQNLLILKRHSLWMLYGTSSSNFQVKQVSNEAGCIDPRSIVEYNGGVYFMSERGFMFYDGSRLLNASPGLNSTLVANARKQAGPQGVDGGYARASQVGPGYIMVTTGVMDGATLTAASDSDAWLLHAPTGAWQQLSSGAIPAILAGGTTLSHNWLMTDTKLVKANYLFNPVGAPASTRGFDSIDSGATKFIIPSRWTTRALPLGTPPRRSKLQRVTADYYWSLANGGWQVTATTRGATGVATKVGTLAAPTGITASLPARGAVDVFNETDEVYLDIAATSSSPATFNDAELHRLLIESSSAAPVPSAL